MANQAIGPYEPLYAKLSTTKYWRGIMLVISIIVALQGLTIYRKMDNLYFVSHIGGILVIIYYLLSFIHSLSHRTQPGPLTNILTIVFQLTVSLQFMIFVFFWALLSFPELDRVLSNPNKGEAAKEFFIMLFQHMVYPMALWFTLFTERTCFKKSNVWVIVVFSLFYCILNGYKTFSSGVPVYDVVDWKGPVSHIHLGFGLGLVFLGFYISQGASTRISHALGYGAKQKGK